MDNYLSFKIVINHIKFLSFGTKDKNFDKFPLFTAAGQT